MLAGSVQGVDGFIIVHVFCLAGPLRPPWFTKRSKYNSGYDEQSIYSTSSIYIQYSSPSPPLSLSRFSFANLHHNPTSRIFQLPPCHLILLVSNPFPTLHHQKCIPSPPAQNKHTHHASTKPKKKKKHKQLLLLRLRSLFRRLRSLLLRLRSLVVVNNRTIRGIPSVLPCGNTRSGITRSGITRPPHLK